ncbi:MAG: aminodeoxychorismate/anthranilate synthase component II [Thermogutta sp.]|nr:aminodeoxychorismate/anthranilate synthase component II [Thermogutta sp.]
MFPHLRVLLVDHHDSFVYNLGRYFELLGCRVAIVRPTEVPESSNILRLFDLVVLSPGPCGPQNVVTSVELVHNLADQMPILGVCLGHQIIAEAFGGRIIRAAEPVHGRATPVWHDGQHEFAGIPNPFPAGRYHSLIADRDSISEEVEISAWTDDGIPMAIRHSRYPVVGWQFHPESVLTPLGLDLLRNLLLSWNQSLRFAR